MNVSASGLSKILLQVIPHDFSKFSPVKIRPFFSSDRVRLYRIRVVRLRPRIWQLHRAGLRCLLNYGYGPG
jgi:hypothetical protein